MNKSSLTILIIEPNKNLTFPYKFLPKHYHTTRVTTIEAGQNYLAQTLPNAVCLSASFAIEDILTFLETLTRQCYHHLPVLALVIDLTRPVTTIPGTNWGHRLMILHSGSGQDEVGHFQKLLEHV